MRTTSGDQVVKIDDLPSGFGTTPREGTLADLSRPEKQPDREQSECLGRASQVPLVGSSEPHVWQYCNALHFCRDASVAPHQTRKTPILPALELTMNQVRDLFPDPGLTSQGMVRLRRIR